MNIKIILEDGAEFHGKSFGYEGSAAGELVFSTAMTGYPESITDPSYKGQILVMTYPLTGNYGAPSEERDNNNIPKFLESDDIHISALVACDYSQNYSHWGANQSLDDWMKQRRVPGIYGVDTRAMVRHIREKGNMLCKLVYENRDIPFYNPYDYNLVEKVSCKEKIVYGNGAFRILLVDCGVKYNIIRELIAAGATVIRAPWDYDFANDDYDGLFISNGPGNPEKCEVTIKNVAKALQRNKPIMGISLGSNILGLAAGAKTFKLQYGHHGHNLPVKQTGSDNAFISLQNHSFAVDMNTLPNEWESCYVNLNDGTNEGFRHKTKAFFATLFHREQSGAEVEREYLFAQFIEAVIS